ncbi:uncharacterized protein LOC135384986 [Ornithodoros turicata]|uniref:uncharacterized protein LOC135384986 n=1 Tax=Ornithodoros turicata TaxID=34597 RepID=UPI003139248E
MHRQSWMYRNILAVQVSELWTQNVAAKRLVEFRRLAKTATEAMWSVQIRQLLRLCDKPRKSQSQAVHTPEPIQLPPGIAKVLSLGPKFAAEPRCSGPEMLSIVHQVASKAAEEDHDRCVSEGVDIVSRHNADMSRNPIQYARAFLQENELAVLPADKEGGFVVLPKGKFIDKATCAVSAVLERRRNVSLAKVKTRAKELCRQLHVDKLVKTIDRSERDSLEVFFSGKTHKPGVPLRVIVSERGTWQKAIALFLQEKLNMLEVEDPFLIRSSDKVIEFLRSHPSDGFSALSVDIKDLYYSLPHDLVSHCVEEAIEKFGNIRFQNATGISVCGFLELLSVYLNSTYVKWQGEYLIQKQGICIGSCLAPVLSDIVLARLDREIAGRVQNEVVRVFRYVDDYLVVLRHQDTEQMMESVLTSIQEALRPLETTQERMTNGSIKFLDLSLTFTEEHACWMYSPRGNKPLLPFSSAHSKLVKRSIINTCFRNAINKSCPHSMSHSMHQQAIRLEKSGYPTTLLTTVAESLLRKTSSRRQSDPELEDRTARTAVIPYIHKVSHKLKKMAGRADVRVVFSAPEKLIKLCRLLNGVHREPKGCKKQHRNPYVECRQNVVYRIPLSCGKSYVGQTGRCVNDRLREHWLNFKNCRGGWLAEHCRVCGCEPVVAQCVIIGRNSDRTAREIIEAQTIKDLGQTCVSVSSIALPDRELTYLDTCKSRKNRQVARSV